MPLHADACARDSADSPRAPCCRTFSRPSGVCEMMRSALKFSWSTDVSPLASSAHDAMLTRLATRANHGNATKKMIQFFFTTNLFYRPTLDATPHAPPKQKT